MTQKVVSLTFQVSDWISDVQAWCCLSRWTFAALYQGKWTHHSYLSGASPLCSHKHWFIHLCICKNMCSIPAGPFATLNPLLNLWMTPASPVPHAVTGSEWSSHLPLLIISFNLRKQASTAVSIPHLKTAAGMRTLCCLLCLCVWEGSRDTNWHRERGGERDVGKEMIKWALTNN